MTSASSAAPWNATWSRTSRPTWTHVDLMRLRRTTKINLFIPVEIVGAEVCPGLKKGGMLNTIRPEVELMVTAGDIPDHITLDISKSVIGDTLTISDITLPEGAKPTIDRDFVIANIAAPTVLGGGASDDEEEAEAEA